MQNASLYLRQLVNGLEEELKGENTYYRVIPVKLGSEWICKLLSDSLVLVSITMKFRITIM